MFALFNNVSIEIFDLNSKCLILRTLEMIKRFFHGIGTKSKNRRGKGRKEFQLALLSKSFYIRLSNGNYWIWQFFFFVLVG